jgi:hypothetical protein
MAMVTSRDLTTIAFDSAGEGSVVILVSVGPSLRIAGRT